MPCRLRGESLAARMLRHGWHVAPPEFFVADLYRQLCAEPDPFADMLDIDTPAGPRAVPVDMRNSQFIAADPRCFPQGSEPDVAAVIDWLLPDDGVFWDCGANWGCFALTASLRPGFRGQVVAVEPAPRPLADLRALAAALALPLRIEACALGDAPGQAVLSQPLMSGAASLHDTAGTVTVPVRALDAMDLPAPHLIKLDVEGAETAALRGATETLARHRPAIVLECRTDTPGGDWAGPLRMLAARGYALDGLEYADGALHLRPISAATRDDFPLHLNVLARPV